MELYHSGDCADHFLKWRQPVITIQHAHPQGDTRKKEGPYSLKNDKNFDNSMLYYLCGYYFPFNLRF
jgi:hypothetical protein